jgi:hypothetical protein
VSWDSVASCWLNLNILTMHGPMNVKFKTVNALVTGTVINRSMDLQPSGFIVNSRVSE